MSCNVLQELWTKMTQFEYRETKAKVITLTNHKRQDNPVD